MSLPGAEADLLRQMVRQVLMEVVPQTMSARANGPAGVPAFGDAVVINNDEDLTAFARLVAGAPDDVRATITSGATRFRLAGPPANAADRTASATATPSPPSPPSVVRVDKGAVTERHVRAAATQGSALVIGRRAVLTPLARDRARAAGVEITRED